MTTAEDCHKKAGQWLSAAKAASNAETSASMRRVSELWAKLALQIKHTNSAENRFNSSAARPVDLVGRGTFRRVETVEVADVLRQRLNLSNDADDEA